MRAKFEPKITAKSPQKWPKNLKSPQNRRKKKAEFVKEIEKLSDDYIMTLYDSD